VLVVLGVAAGALVTTSVAPNAEGATTNKTVYGTIYNHLGQPIGGMSVVVEIWGGFWPVQEFFRISKSTVSDSSGYYQVTISSNYWDPHNTIVVIVTHDSVPTTKKTEANGDEFQEVDMTVNIPIPEFGSIGLLTVVAGCTLPIVAFLRRRRG
jgi:hypothetical protein